MGDLVTKQSNKDLYYVDKDIFKKIETNKNIPLAAKLEIKSKLHRINILFMIMSAGSGHIGSSFSIIDFLTVIYNSKLKDELIFSSKGHDSPAFYSIGFAHNLISKKLFFNFRKINGLPGHPDRSIKIFKFNTGSLGMGISKAKGFLKNSNNKLAFVILGDGELQEGQIWESINSKLNKGLKIIIDKNNLQSDFTTNATLDIGDISKKLKSFNLRVRKINGHNFESILNALHEVDSYDCLILNTIKGQGVKLFHGDPEKFQNVNYTFHSGAPSYRIYISAINELVSKIQTKYSIEVKFRIFKQPKKNISAQVIEPNHSILDIYSEFIQFIIKGNKMIRCLDADLLVDHGLLEIKKKFPKRIIECGIAEMDMVSQASGMSEAGFLPICHSFSCFMSFRSLEQIYNNCSEKRKIIYTASLCGILPAGPGHSHQAVKDISNLASIPGLVVVEPLDSSDFHDVYNHFKTEKNTSLFIRLNPIKTNKITSVKKTKIHQGKVLKNWVIKSRKKKVIIFTYGNTFSNHFLNLASKLSTYNIKIVSLIYLNRFDVKWFKNQISNSDKVLFFDNQLYGFTPFTMLINELNTKLNFYPKYYLNQIENFPLCGDIDEIFSNYKLNLSDIKKLIQRL